MLRAMKAPSLSLSSTLLSLVLAAFTVVGCSKDNKADGDAAADAAEEAAAPVVVADAAPEAAVALVDAAVVPLATVVAPRPVIKAPPPDPPICQNARAARKRGSPAAPGLEAQCKAQGGSL